MTDHSNSGAPAEGRIPDRLFFKIGEVADIAKVKPYVLRYWETEFSFLTPQKKASGQRIYRRGDVEMILLIKHLLYQERYSIEGAKKKLRELKKGGELVAAKQAALSAPDMAVPVKAAGPAGAEVVTSSRGSPIVSGDALRAIREVADELRALIQNPPSDLFRF